MNLYFCSPRFHRLTIPGALLLALLQRAPVVRAVIGSETVLLTSPVAQVLRSVLTAVASLGAVQTMAGATPLVPSQGSETGVSVAVGSAVDVAYTVSGTLNKPQSWTVSGAFPPGLSFSGLTATGTANVQNLRLSGTPTTAGNYDVMITAWQGPNATLTMSPTYNYRVTVTGAASTAPAISTQPGSVTVQAGQTITLTAAATGSPEPTLQWQKGGTAVANGGRVSGATTGTLTITGATSGDAGTYTFIATNSAGSATSNAVTVTVNDGPQPPSAAWLSNLSVRTNMSAGQTLIVGFTVAGGAENILVRAAGPALAETFPQFFTAADVMADPRLSFYPSGSNTAVSSNDNWASGVAGTSAAVGAFPFTNGSKDAAFVQSIDGPNNTVWAQGTGGGTVLVEAYAVGNTQSPRLTNLSARNHVGSGDNILIAGFVVKGTGTKRLLVRGIGPRLAELFGLTGVLADPKLEIYDSTNTKIAENDNWDGALASTFSAVGAYAFTAGAKDAALVITVPANASYTAQVKGADGGTGEAVVEVFEVP